MTDIENIALSEFWHIQEQIYDDSSSIFLKMMHHYAKSSSSHFSNPLEINLDITNKCMQKCTHCFASSRRGSLNIPLSVIDQVIDAKPAVVVLSGGEPFLNPEILYIVKKLKSAGIIVKILSNGTLITSQIIENLISSGLDSHDLIQISLDAASPSTYAIFRGVNQFNDCMRGARLVSESPIPLKIHSVITNTNLSEVLDILELAISLNADFYSGGSLAPIGSAKISDLVDPLKLITLENKVYHRCEYSNTKYCGGISGELCHCLSAQIPYKDHPRITACTSFQCNATTISCYIDASGNFYPCIFAVNSNLMFGNLKTHSVNACWELLQKSSFCHMKYSSSSCEKCEWLGLCNGGCPGIGYEWSKKLGAGTDPRCYRYFN